MILRVRFTKLGRVRFVGHRDLARIWERALRKARVDLVMTEGFTPRPKVAFGLALPTTYESVCEYMDIHLGSLEVDGCVLETAELASVLSDALPIGIDVVEAAVVERGGPSLQQAVFACRWECELPSVDPDQLGAILDRVLSAAALPVVRQRKGRSYTDDLRESVLGLTAMGQTAAGSAFMADLACQPRSVRPGEVLRAVDPALQEGLVRRTHQWICVDGERREPLPVDASALAPALVCAP